MQTTKKLTKAGRQIIDNFCKRNKINGQIKSDLIDTIQLFINNNQENTYPAYSKDFKCKSELQQEINRVVCGYYNVEPEKIFVSHRGHDECIIRQVAQYFGRKIDRDSNAVIGINTGGKNGSTICWSFNKISTLIDNPRTSYNNQLAEDIEEISKRLNIT